jgi:hypothetical protein
MQLAQCLGDTGSGGTGGGNTEPNDPSCDDIDQFLADQGYDLPLSDEDASVLYQECVDSMGQNADGSAELCDKFLQCVDS